MVFNDEVVNIFAEQLKISKEDIVKMANRDENKSFNDLKVCQIKDVIRAFKAKGHCNLSTTPNKPQLIESLFDILSGKTAGMSPAQHQTQTITDWRATNHQLQVQHQQRQRELVERQRQHQQELQRQIQQQRQIQKNELKHAQISHMQQQALLSDGQTINTPLKRQVFDDLMRQPGLTREEVLREINEACSGGREDEEALDADMMLFNIVTRREQEQITSQGGVVENWEVLQQEEAVLKQREDADMDRAILESEQEREVIQSRKRRRVSEMRTDMHCLIGTADEYRHSILICSDFDEGSERLESQRTDGSGSDGSGNSSSCVMVPPVPSAPDACVDLTADSDDEETNKVVLGEAGVLSLSTVPPPPPPSRTVGSKVLQALVRLLDAWTGEESSSSSSSSGVYEKNSKTILTGDIGQVALLRAELVQLLLLEVDALKYHRVAGVPYLRGLALHVDSMLNAFGGRTLHNQQPLTQPLSSTSITATGSFRNEELQVQCEVDRVLSYLALQSCRLQKALYRLPRDGHMVPLLFRKAFRDRRLSAGFHSSIAEDGFELLDDDEVEAIGLLGEEVAVKDEDGLSTVRTVRARSVYSEEEEEASSGDDESMGGDSDEE